MGNVDETTREQRAAWVVRLGEDVDFLERVVAPVFAEAGSRLENLFPGRVHLLIDDPDVLAARVREWPMARHFPPKLVFVWDDASWENQNEDLPVPRKWRWNELAASVKRGDTGEVTGVIFNPNNTRPPGFIEPNSSTAALRLSTLRGVTTPVNVGGPVGVYGVPGGYDAPFFENRRILSLNR